MIVVNFPDNEPRSTEKPTKLYEKQANESPQILFANDSMGNN